MYLNEDGLDRLPANLYGCRMIGYDLAQHEPLCGPLVLVPREQAQGSAAAERAAHERFFALLERVSRGELPPTALGYAALIDARQG